MWTITAFHKNEDQLDSKWQSAGEVVLQMLFEPPFVAEKIKQFPIKK